MQQFQKLATHIIIRGFTFSTCKSSKQPNNNLLIHELFYKTKKSCILHNTHTHTRTHTNYQKKKENMKKKKVSKKDIHPTLVASPKKLFFISMY